MGAKLERLRAGRQAFDLSQPPRQARAVWVAVHGWLEQSRFIHRDCALHQCGLAVAYPLAPWWRAQNWAPRHASDVARVAEAAQELTGAEIIIIAGHSDGCATIHEAAALVGAAYVVHWAGLWRDRWTPADCPAIMLHGSEDRTPTVATTLRAARRYNAEVLEIPAAGHAWANWFNPQLIERVYSDLQLI